MTQMSGQPAPDPREARKYGTDTPGEPTDEFVVHAFAQGARMLWPDSRDPGWHVTFGRWLAARDVAAHTTTGQDATDPADEPTEATP